MIHGDISAAPSLVLMFDLMDFFVKPKTRVDTAISFVLEAVGLRNLSLDLLEINPEAVRTVEYFGVYHNLAIYVLVHGHDQIEAAKKKLGDAWISRFLLAKSLKDIQDIMESYRVLCYFSSVVPTVYRANVNGVVPFTGWKDISLERL